MGYNAHDFMRFSFYFWSFAKIADEAGNTIEIKMWVVPKTVYKPYGFKYSLVYIVNNKRIVGYDNAEGKGDHRHYKERKEPYLSSGFQLTGHTVKKSQTRVVGVILFSSSIYLRIQRP